MAMPAIGNNIIDPRQGHEAGGCGTSAQRCDANGAAAGHG
jgi:hypothetical protein